MRVSEPPKKSDDEVVSLFRRLAYDLFHERLRIDHSLCYSVSIDEYTGNSFFYIGLNVKTEVINIDLVIKEFWKVIEEIVQKKHLDKFYTIKKLGINQVRSKERLSNDIGHIAIRDISRSKGKTMTLEDRLKAMQKVTYNDLIKFAKETFDPAFTFTEIITPSKKVDPLVKTLIL